MATERFGVDIGGSGIKGAPVDVERGALLAERVRIETPQPSKPDAIADVVHELVTGFGWDGPVGCAFPAVVTGGVVRTAANVHKSWIGTDAAALLGERIGQPVHVVNDADAAGLAEMRFGAGRDRMGHVVMITLGTGIGSALFTNGVLTPNSELGHLELHGSDAESLASDRVREEDELSWKKWAKRVEAYVRLLEDLLWPDLVIVGGGVSKKAEKFLPLLDVRTEVVAAALLNDAGIVGAALVAPS